MIVPTHQFLPEKISKEKFESHSAAPDSLSPSFCHNGCLSLSVCPSDLYSCLSVCLFISLYAGISLSLCTLYFVLCMSISLSFIFLSVTLYVCLSSFLFVSLFFSITLYLSVSLCLSVRFFPSHCLTFVSLFFLSPCLFFSLSLNIYIFLPLYISLSFFLFLLVV